MKKVAWVVTKTSARIARYPARHELSLFRTRAAEIGTDMCGCLLSTRRSWEGTLRASVVVGEAASRRLRPGPGSLLGLSPRVEMQP